MRKKSLKDPRRRLPPLLPRQKKERRRVELLGATATLMASALIITVFLATGLQQFLLRSSNVAAVVSVVLVDLANGDRAANALPVLTLNPVLVAAAQAKANDMATYGYFAHVSPQGVYPWHWFAVAGYKFDYAGENLAVDFSDSGDVERAWMNSPAHRENILSAHYSEIGIATAQGMYQGRPTTFVVQEFGAPAHAGVAQERVRTATVPTSPTQPAVATTQRPVNQPTIAPNGAQVLGSSVKETGVSGGVATTNPALAASLVKDVSGNVPPWAYIVSFPRDTLRYIYYVIGLLVLVALAAETGFEIRWHHRKHALRAGVLMASMYILFVVSNYLFFAQPALAATGSQSASATLSL